MQDIQLFRSLVSNQNGTPVTTSNKIADTFGKQHKNVLRAIDKLECSAEFSRLNFELCYENNDLQNGKPNRYFKITKDGAAFLIMTPRLPIVYTTAEILQKLDYLAGIHGSKKAAIEAAINELHRQDVIPVLCPNCGAEYADFTHEAEFIGWNGVCAKCVLVDGVEI